MFLQVGSFGESGDAESLKARLALMGVQAQVTPVKINDRTWHRVRVGPYADARALEAAKRELAAANVEAIALRETGGCGAGCGLQAAKLSRRGGLCHPGRPWRCACLRIELSRASGPFFLSAKDAKDAKKAGASLAVWAFDCGGHSDTCLRSSLRPLRPLRTIICFCSVT